ncbi:putative malate dehydrogenase (oxaloacetate-decarboxylating) (NADP(+)) [Helianthus anomalus]|nr:putative malate dehydrogenase (oxaloacetate-decarboxylating) (NADP(+)) [Helianthus annuus]
MVQFLTGPVLNCLATRLPQPEDLVAYAESCMYSPKYRNYR